MIGNKSQSSIIQRKKNTNKRIEYKQFAVNPRYADTRYIEKKDLMVQNVISLKRIIQYTFYSKNYQMPFKDSA